MAIETENDVIVAVRRAIAIHLSQGHPTIHHVARTVGINARTLQRRLARHRRTYRQLVDEVRLEIACSLLKAQDKSIGQIAVELGYSDPAHFTRAFGRMTGVTPRGYQMGTRDRAAG